MSARVTFQIQLRWRGRGFGDDVPWLSLGTQSSYRLGSAYGRGMLGACGVSRRATSASLTFQVPLRSLPLGPLLSCDLCPECGSSVA